MVAIAPHTFGLPLWINAWCLVMWGYMLVRLKTGWPLPGAPIRYGLAVTGIIGLLLTYRVQIRADAFVGLLALMAAIKPFEMATHRHQMITVLLTYFIIITSLFRSESMFIVLYMFFSVFITTIALVCAPAAPKCSDCPLSKQCSSFKTQTLDRFPVRIPSRKVPTRTIAVGIVRKNGRLLITRRQLDGLLGGLWEFPGGKLEKGEDSPSACVREIREETGIHVKIDSFLTRIKHAYTHFKIEMDVFYCHYVSGEIELNGPIDHKWVQISEINGFPFPKANLKFIPLIKMENT